MKPKKTRVCVILLTAVAALAAAQPSALRDYVGTINQTYHPDVVDFINKIKERAQKRGNTDAAKAYDSYLKGGFGTGFVYVASNGTNYIITNHHVVSKAYTLSITFEKLDGSKTVYEKLRIVAADEDIDIAVLTFANDARPFRQGLSFVSAPTEEGSRVWTAGFPGIGNQVSWQFADGIISNAAFRIQAEASEDVPEAQLGPYIQHTAPMDPGNSGGPLLVQQTGATTGYAVTGINTFKARRRENTNFSIPASRALAYIQSALRPADGASLRASLDRRLDSFVKGLAVNKAVYPHIAQYLSNSCVAGNAEFAIDEVFDRGSRTAQADVDNTWSYYSPLFSMNVAVAWLVEDSLRGKSTGAIRATLGAAAGNSDGSYTVPIILADGRTVNTTWVNEYGIWKLDKAGDLVTGDKSLLEKKEKKRELAAKLRTDYMIAFSADYAQIFDNRPAVKLALEVKSGITLYDFELFFGKEVFGDDALSAGYVLAGITFPIAIAGKVALMPFAEAGLGLTFRGKLDADRERQESAWDIYGVKSSKPIEFGLCLKVGTKFFFAAVPGLFAEGAYQFDYFLGREKWVRDNDKHRIMVGIGYAL